MATEFKRYIHVADTTTTLTTANDLMVKGEPWYDVTLKKFKIADATAAYNSVAFYIHAWDDISGKPSSHPSTIADVTGLTSALAGKSDTGHTHAWADITSKPTSFNPSSHTHAQSDITNLTTDLAGKASATHTHAASDVTSGTFDPARLPLATTTAFGAVKVGTGLSVTAGVLSATGGGGGADRGNLFDVRKFGALTGHTNEDATTKAFQDAVDAIEKAGGGTLYIPATGESESYFLRRPIWIGSSGICVTGEGVHATKLTSTGPAFITAANPMKWECGVTSYVDSDTGSTVLVKSGGIATDRSRYRMDLTQFMAGGKFAPCGNRPPLNVPTGPGYFGLRTRNGVVGGRYPQASLATGDNNGRSNFFTQWDGFDKVEWNFAFYHHEPALVGGIAGCGGLKAPDPWILWGDGKDYVFDLALTDADGIRRTWVRCRFPQPGDKGLHRITIQFDANAATNADFIKASVDGIRRPVTLNNFSDSVIEYHAMNEANSSVDLTGLRTEWNRISKWNGSDFTTCNESHKVG